MDTKPHLQLFVSVLVACFGGSVWADSQAARAPSGSAKTSDTRAARLRGVGELAEHVHSIDGSIPRDAVRVHRENGQWVTRVGDDGNEPPGVLAYDNTVDTGELLTPGEGISRRITDDISLAALGGCDVTAFEFTVGGNGDGTGPGFTVEFGVYDGCPSRGGALIPGLSGAVELPHDGLHDVLVDLSDAPAALPSTIWFGLHFSRAGVGWLTGSQAFVGFTDNAFDFPSFACSASFAEPFWGGFDLRVYCAEEYTEVFRAYHNVNADGEEVSFPANTWIVDDISLAIPECVVGEVEVTSTNTAPYTLTAELWTNCHPGAAIPGSRMTFEGSGEDGVQTARFVFEDGIPLPSDFFFVALRYDTSSAGPLFVESPSIGESEDFIGQVPVGEDFCELVSFGGNPEASLSIAVSCIQEAPVGACCRRLSDAPCKIANLHQCSGSNQFFIEGATCDPDPFDPPCGTSACCLPEPGPRGSCQNLQAEACDAMGGVSNSPHLCGQAPDCGWFVCRDGEGECCLGHEGPACERAGCCSDVCDVDQWCCTVAWDGICAERAAELCSSNCPLSAVTFVDPPSEIVDARQPHGLGAPAARLGIDRIRIAYANSSISACCFTLCETGSLGASNEIINFDEIAPDIYELTLARPITPGALTAIRYGTGAFTINVGSFYSHPGNVNGDSFVAISDLATLTAILADVETPLYGLYSCDIDRSGACNPADLLRAIDLLNGGGFDPWLNTPLPQPIGGLCP